MTVAIHTGVLLALAAATGAGVPAPAVAQTAPQAQENVAEIIVSARKREERLQEVPLSVAVFDTAALQARNIQTVYDVATFTPNFSFTRNVVGRRLDAPSIRGQFTPQQNFGSEANVAFYVDGVYVSGTASSLTVDNLERVEILRGPQAAQFGRGAFAGAINYVTRAPTSELDGQVYLKAGEERDFKVSAFASGPIIDSRLLFFVSASAETFDGEWQNSMNPCRAGETAAANGCIDFLPIQRANWPAGQPASAQKNDFTPLGGESTQNLTGKLSWTALENLMINVKAEYTEADDEHYASLFQPALNCYVPNRPDDPRAAVTSPASPGWRCGEITADGLRAVMNIADLREGATSFQATGTAAPAPFIGTQTDTTRLLTEGLLDLAGWNLVARATLNSQELESYRDLDRSPYLGPLFANLFASGEIQTWDDNSVEVRATSPQDKPLRGAAGAYYFTAENEAFQREFTGFCERTVYGQPLVDGATSWTLNAEKENLSFFGSVEYDVVDSVTVSLESRYAKDSPVQRAPNGVTARDNYYSLAPRATVAWQVTDDINAYALVARGNKAGGFFYGYFDAPVTRAATEAALADGRARIKEEKAWTYELGAKTQWLDRRLTANISAYFIDWTNQAINENANIAWECPPGSGTVTDVPNLIIRNAGKSEVMGGEIELSWAATDNLYLTLNYGLADTKLVRYTSLTLANLTVDPGAPGGPALLAAGIDVSGNQAPHVPKHTLAGSATYSHPLGDRGAEWFLRGDYIYNAKSYLDAANEVYIGDLNLVNARIGIESVVWTAAFYVDNVTGEETPLLATDFPNFRNFPRITSAFHVIPRRGRNAGIALTYRF